MIKKISAITGLNLVYSGQNEHPLFWLDVIEHILKDDSGNEYVLAIAMHDFDKHYLRMVADNFNYYLEDKMPILFADYFDGLFVLLISSTCIDKIQKSSNKLSCMKSILELFPQEYWKDITSFKSYKKIQKNIKDNKVSSSFFALKTPFICIPSFGADDKLLKLFFDDVKRYREKRYKKYIINHEVLVSNDSFFSLNRFDVLYPNNKNYLMSISDGISKNNIAVSFKDDTAILGTWNSYIPRTVFLILTKYIFRTFKSIKKIEYNNLLFDPFIDPKRWRHNDFYIPLPDSVDELKQRLSAKSRHNLKRERRLIEEAFSNLRLEDVDVTKEFSVEILQKFYEFKNQTHGIDQAQYDITKRSVTNVYLLKTGGNDIRGIALSCEQGQKVFIENHTFDSSLRDYSFGQVLYDMYLEKLIEKRKKGLSLSGGDLEYKKRYGSICFLAYSGTLKKIYSSLTPLSLLIGSQNNMAISKFFSLLLAILKRGK